MHNSQKPADSIPRFYCDRFSKHFSAFTKQPKLGNFSDNTTICKTRSLSTGRINNSTVVKPKKTTKSDVIFCKNNQQKIRMKYVENCGDTKVSSSIVSNSKKSDLKSSQRHASSPNQVIKCVKNKSLLQQHYKNENFHQSADSIPTNGFEKPSLNTIDEQSETFSKPEPINEYYNILDSYSILDGNDSNIEDLKQFRDENYFECHSAKSRIKTQGSVTGLNNHKCVYRFYLNERLFPVPINEDYNHNIRCMECHLPLDVESEQINGTIQAKAKLNNKVQDIMLMLPVNKSVILKERRKELRKDVEDDCLYFGIIKLNLNGDSMFNRNIPSDSFALKYQKGYKEFRDSDRYEYKNVDRQDVIII